MLFNCLFQLWPEHRLPFQDFLEIFLSLLKQMPVYGHKIQLNPFLCNFQNNLFTIIQNRIRKSWSIFVNRLQVRLTTERVSVYSRMFISASNMIGSALGTMLPSKGCRKLFPLGQSGRGLNLIYIHFRGYEWVPPSPQAFLLSATTILPLPLPPSDYSMLHELLTSSLNKVQVNK